MKEEFECSCQRCVKACKDTPGWFLPGEAEKAAEYLNVSPQDFFDTYLGVDWYIETPKDIFVLAPALKGEDTGDMYPGDPRGTCVFLNEDDKCSIHDVKPFECKKLTCDDKDVASRHKDVAVEWISEQDQITELLGKVPVSREYDSSIFGFISSWATKHNDNN